MSFWDRAGLKTVKEETVMKRVERIFSGYRDALAGLIGQQTFTGKRNWEGSQAVGGEGSVLKGKCISGQEQGRGREKRRKKPSGKYSVMYAVYLQHVMKICILLRGAKPYPRLT